VAQARGDKLKTDVLALVAALSNGQADQVSASNFYDESIYALDEHLWLTTFVLIAASSTSPTMTIALPATTITLRGLVYDTRWLQESDLRSIESWATNWRAFTGREPFCFVLQDQTHLDFQVFPVPPVTGTAFSPPGTFGASYPARNFVAFTTEFRSTVPKWLESSVTLAVLSREYERSSDHTDPDAKAAADLLTELLLTMVA